MFTDFSLDRRINKAIEELGYETPTPVQSATIPLALEKKDLKVSAETGSGKTAAFLIPAIQHFLAKDAKDTGTRALIIVPTRELARQVYKTLQQLTRHTPLKGMIIMGGEDYKYQHSLLRKNPEFIVATPGRLVEHIERGNTDLKDLEVLIIDEADRMMELGFNDDVSTIAAQCKKERQTLFFSATLKPHALSALADELLEEPETLLLNTRRDQQLHIRQQHILADDKKHKQNIVDRLLYDESFDKCLIFTNTKVETDQFSAFLRYKKHHVVALHGDMDQLDRKLAMDQFRSGNAQIMVATDVASRGLDIEGIDLVINFDMARTVDDHIHRIGRTGRAGQEGTAISLVGANDWARYTNVEQRTKQILSRRSIKGLEATFTGIKKKKKTADSVKKRPVKKTADKSKERVRNRKNKGKPKRAARIPDQENTKTPAAETETASERVIKSIPKQGGFAPIKKKKKVDNLPLDLDEEHDSD
ncbi:MAG: DEAD/DEAH box helicase [Pseudomonadales bacterium]|nr:DEAD/DEAH box helicase [Pseudomonadales bacterium]